MVKILAFILVTVLFVLLVFPFANSLLFFEEIAIENWLSLTWQPDEDQYGFGTALIGSLLIVLLSLPTSLFFGWLLAIQLNDTSSSWMKKIMIPLLETWVSIPSVIIGIWAISQLVPFVRGIDGSGFCWLSAVIGLTIFILPTTTLLFYRSYQMYRNKFGDLEKSFNMRVIERSVYFLLSSPATFVTTGIYTFCRLFGETMIVLMLSGNSVQVPSSLFESVRTLTATIALEMAYATDIHESSLFTMASIATLILLLVVLLQKKEPSYD